jgi:tRNA modification GTPase
VDNVQNYEATIAAISTAVSNAGIGIVRMSGPEAFAIADSVYKGKKEKRLSGQKSHTIHYGYIVDGEYMIDEVLVMLMRGPHSYTGEDTVEINCHGGVYVVKRILELLISRGARPAEPGEFTKRAFLNGRLDLSQAEAVGDLIVSQNQYALRNSVSQLRGNIREKIGGIREQIIYHTAFIETALDDPEHISVDGYGDKLRGIVENLLKELQKLMDTYDSGRIMKEGIQTVILGRPNAGKSSLMNVLLGEDRAIVTDIAGTTRDILEEHINLRGISLNIVDTAGIRQTQDIVEQIGVERARSYADQADLIIYVIDASMPLDENDHEILRLIEGKTSIILLNKSDLDTVVTEADVEQAYFASNPSISDSKEINKFTIPVIPISATEKNGIDQLEETLKLMFFEGNLAFNDEIYITNVRQKTALWDASSSLEKVIDSIEAGMPEDFYSIDLMDAYEALGRITGETMGEDLVNEIFSKFCMGK